MGTMEKRSFTRVPFSSEAVLKIRDARIRGLIENISLRGAYVKIQDELEVGQSLEMEIFLAEPASDLSLVLNGTVVRRSPDGIGIQFSGMSLDVYERIRDMIADIVGDKHKVVMEFIDYMSKRPGDSDPV
jgi:hypothetical protein